ncbi:hypothetical protein ACQKC5_01975 [Shewanella baltica]|uniref:hypothetical protein n=1 Tax=Shewanella baltica TaxID=62322 RepID=UPI003D002AF8
MDSDIDLVVSFRFLALSEEQADELKATGLLSRFGVHFKTKKITGLIPLSSSSTVGISEFIKKHGIEVSDTDIFISFSTEYDSRIIDIPDFVNEAILKIGSKMVLSYTVA